MSQVGTHALREVLAAAAGVLQDLEGRCCSLQDALSTTLGAPAPSVAIQDLDYVTQGLAGLSHFLAALADGLPPHWRADAEAAAHGLPLAAMAAALRLAAPEATGAAGELELFE